MTENSFSVGDGLTEWIVDGAKHQLTQDTIVALCGRLHTDSTVVYLTISGKSLRFFFCEKSFEYKKNDAAVRNKGFDFEDNATAALATALRKNKTLQYLDLSSSRLGKLGLQRICRSLHDNNTLRRLDLSQTGLCDKSAVEIADLLARNSTIQFIDASLNRVGDPGSQSIADALRVNSGLLQLSLVCNYIEDAGAQAISNALQSDNSTLECLVLSYNNIGSSGAKAFAEALMRNFALKKLDFSHNNLRGSGTEAIARALRVNSTLLYLDVSQNAIGDRGALAMADLLKSNSMLETLEMTSSSVREFARDAVLSALECNFTLQMLGLCRPVGDAERCQKQESLMARNGLLAEIYRDRNLFERTADVCAGLASIFLPIYVLKDIVQWTLACEMANVEMESTGKQYATRRQYFAFLDGFLMTANWIRLIESTQKMYAEKCNK